MSTPADLAELDRHIAVSRVDDGRWSADLRAAWSVGGGLNGGYLLAVLGNAVRAALPQTPDPLVVSAYFTAAAVAGPAEVSVEVKRTGRSRTTVAAELSQQGSARVSALATYGDLAGLPAQVLTTAQRPAMPPVEECVPSTLAPEEVQAIAPLMSRFEMRFHPEQVGWAVGSPSGEGVLSAWFRLPDREPDAISLLGAVDALPPVTFPLGMPGWAPTLELTAHVRAVPAPGWLLLRHETRNMAGGLFEEDCEVWDAAGRLVAQSRQLALQPRPA